MSFGRILSYALIGVGTAAVGAVFGAGVIGMEKDEEIAKLTMENNKLCRKIQGYLEKMDGTEQYFYFIKTCFAFGVAIAKVDDGRIDEDEMRELNEFLYGKAGEKLPENIKKEMENMLKEEMPFEKVWPFIENKDDKDLVDRQLFIKAMMDGKVSVDEAWPFIKNKDGKVSVDEKGREVIRDMLYDVANANGDFHKNQKEFIMKYEAGMKRLV